jgi:hypothetical protein
MSALLILLGIGAVFSVLAPVRIGARGRRALSQGQGNEGCLSALSRMVAMVILVVLMVPVTLACRLGGESLWCLLAPPYAAAVLWVGIRMASGAFVNREEGIMATLARGAD